MEAYEQRTGGNGKAQERLEPLELRNLMQNSLGNPQLGDVGIVVDRVRVAAEREQYPAKRIVRLRIIQILELFRIQFGKLDAFFRVSQDSLGIHLIHIIFDTDDGCFC